MSIDNLQRQFADTSTHVLALANDLKKQTAKTEALQADIEKIVTAQAAAVVNGNGGQSAAVKANPIVKAGFAQFIRRAGSEQFTSYAQTNLPDVHATMSVQSDPDGGYAVLPDIDKDIMRAIPDISPMRDLASIVTIQGDKFKYFEDPSFISSKWVGETDSRLQTDSSKLFERNVPLCEVCAMPGTTQGLLDNAFFDVGAWLTSSGAMSFALKEGAAFASGSGVNQPRGFLSYPVDTGADFVRPYASIQCVQTGSATPTSTQLADALIALSMVLRVPYRPNACWLMSRDSLRQVRQLRDSNGLLLWSDNGRLVDGAPGFLLGFPIKLSEDMPSISANSLSIALADWRQAYVIVDKLGIRILRDPFTAKPLVLFYMTKRVGGDVRDFRAIKLLKIA